MNLNSIEWPQSETMEKSVLSVIMQHPNRFYDAPNITFEHFHGPGRGEMFRRISAMIQGDKTTKQSAVDSSTLFDIMAHSGDMERIGGASAFAEVWDYCHSDTYFESYVARLNQFHARRIAVKAAIHMIEAATQEEEIETLVAAASAPITEIHNVLTDSKKPRSTTDLVASALQRYIDRAEGRKSPIGIETGIPEIDRTIRGIHPGRMWVIGAYPSGGKSIFAGQILTRMAMEGTPCVFVTLEMPEDDLMDRCVTQASKVPALAFSDPKTYATATSNEGPTTGILNMIKSGAQKLMNSPFSIRKPSNNRLATVLSVIRRAHREMGAKVAAIDFVQKIHGSPTSNKEQEVAEISHAIQELAAELEMHIIVCSQLNVDGDTKHGRVIEEDADAFLHIVQEMDKKKPNFKQHQHILIAKDRHYSKGGEKLPLIFDKEGIRFIHGFPAKEESKKVVPNF
jgi:replicative DNA helicase